LSGKRGSSEGRERLLGIIDLCRAVEEGRHDPFEIEVDGLLEVIRRYFKEWQSMGDRCLDARAVNNLATLLKIQGSWLKDQSSSLYTDPFLIQQKLVRLPREDLADLFLKSWHPVIELEQISPGSLRVAMNYWRDLLPLEDRWDGLSDEAVSEPGYASYEDLIDEEIASDRAFGSSLTALWEEMKKRYDEEEGLAYWQFIRADSFLETVRRAYLTSFLITYGYADLHLDPMGEEMSISPNSTPRSTTEEKKSVSLPIPITLERWLEGGG